MSGPSGIAGIVVFAGLSIACDEVRGLLDADVRGPVRAGDLDPIPAGRNVAIIDGDLTPGSLITRNEIRGALARGVRVSGAASVGAWRAAELGGFGMMGLGWVHGAYQTGRISGTDEIAVLYDPVLMRPLTIPLVNVRYALECVASSGRVSPMAARRALAAVWELPFGDRDPNTVAAILSRHLNPEWAAEFLGSGTCPPKGVKGIDARRLIRRLAPHP